MRITTHCFLLPPPQPLAELLGEHWERMEFMRSMIRRTGLLSESTVAMLPIILLEECSRLVRLMPIVPLQLPIQVLVAQLNSLSLAGQGTLEQHGRMFKVTWQIRQLSAGLENRWLVGFKPWVTVDPLRHQMCLVQPRRSLVVL